MAEQIVNTLGISSSSNKLRTANNNINEEFITLQNKAKELDNNWHGAAGEAARTTMYQLFKYSEERSKVIQNYINILEQQINPGYNNSETVNTKLADKFK